jgi:hypothetical protein
MGITNKIENFKAKANEFLLLSHKIDANILKNEGIETISACTLVMLRTNQF